MSLGPMAEALAPLRARLGAILREREILRVVAEIGQDDAATAMDRARREVLAWAQKRCGSLPEAAWNGHAFDHMVGGRTALGVRIDQPDSDIWALRSDDPDKNVAGRTWTTEVVIGCLAGQSPRLSLRLLLSSPEDEPAIEPAVPGLLRQIGDTCGLVNDGRRLADQPWRVDSDDAVAALIELLGARERRLPVVVASGDERADDPSAPLLDVETLAAKMLGLAHVVVLPAPFTYRLSDEFGKVRSVYHGAARLYLPGFAADADPYEHPLTLGDYLRARPAAQLAALRQRIAKESLRRERLGHEVLSFAALRSAALQRERETQPAAPVAEAQQLKAAIAQIEALTSERDELKERAEEYVDLADAEEQRAKTAESQLAHARERIRHLEDRLAALGERPDDELPLPAAWQEVADWCDRHLIGRLALTPAARKGLKKTRFADVKLVSRCLLWLAGECRNRRLEGGGSLANTAVEPGIENAHCGADSFRFDFQGRRLQADWHIKNGGNTRDPARCLRIYYAWDETTQQIVVADMPAHRRTGAT